MAKDTYSLTDSMLSDFELRSFYLIEKNAFPDCSPDIEILFRIALKERELFPDIKIKGEANERQYLARWIKRYYDASHSFPSKHTASMKKSCSDPAVKAIVQVAKDLTPLEATTQERYHNLFMSAENIQGSLLEEYIASMVRPYGWIWCCGNVFRAIDFCNTNGTTLLQIKNKSITENSSSSAIREGTTIMKWYRLSTRTVAGKKVPAFMWDSLNWIINTRKTEGGSLPPCCMTEEAYQDFLLRVTTNNKMIITDL